MNILVASLDAFHRRSMSDTSTRTLDVILGRAVIEPEPILETPNEVLALGIVVEAFGIVAEDSLVAVELIAHFLASVVLEGSSVLGIAVKEVVGGIAGSEYGNSHLVVDRPAVEMALCIAVVAEVRQPVLVEQQV